MDWQTFTPIVVHVGTIPFIFLLFVNVCKKYLGLLKPEIVINIMILSMFGVFSLPALLIVYLRYNFNSESKDNRSLFTRFVDYLNKD